LTLLDKEKEKIKVLEKEKETLKSYYDSELKNLNKKYEEKEKIIRESILQEEQIKTKKLRDLDEEIRKKSEILSSYEKDLKIMEKKITEIDSSSYNIQSIISEIKKIISQKTDIALNNIQIGMTYDEMIEVAGKYRSSKDNYPKSYNYGNVWVNIEEGLVKCLVKSECPRYSCSSFTYMNIHCILKK
jgi:predicted RNase H-like nuclease (RuvC/YqgF family)